MNIKIESKDIESVDIEDQARFGICTTIWLKPEISDELLFQLGRGKIGRFSMKYHINPNHRIYKMNE